MCVCVAVCMCDYAYFTSGLLIFRNIRKQEVNLNILTANLRAAELNEQKVNKSFLLQ